MSRVAGLDIRTHVLVRPSYVRTNGVCSAWEVGVDAFGASGGIVCERRRGRVRLTRRGRAVVLVLLLLIAGVGLVLASPTAHGW